MNVKNMKSGNGNPVPNQFLITDGDVEYFQSYDVIIAKRVGDSVTLDERYWDYSVTTGRYRNKFLGEGIAVTRKKIKANIYKVDDLNA